MQIVNRTPALPERGKIKIGAKGPKRKSQGGKEFSPPVKLDHFIVTTMERDSNDNYVPDAELMQTIAKATDQDAGQLTRIPIRLLYNDPALNFGSRYASYQGRTLACSGDGKEARRLLKDGMDTIECPCERIEQGYAGPAPACKINGILSVLIDGSPGVGGVWKFRTTSFNSVDGIMGSLMFMASITGGQLANVPLDLVLRKKLAALPDGKQQTIYVVGLEFRGSIDELRDAGYQIALANQQASLRIEFVEAEARKQLEEREQDAVFPGEDADDVVPEYYPEDEQGGEAPQIQAPEGAAPGDEQPEHPKPPKVRSRKKKEERKSPGMEQPEEPAPADEDAPPPLTPPESPAPGDDKDIF